MISNWLQNWQRQRCCLHHCHYYSWKQASQYTSKDSTNDNENSDWDAKSEPIV